MRHSIGLAYAYSRVRSDIAQRPIVFCCFHPVLNALGYIPVDEKFGTQPALT